MKYLIGYRPSEIDTQRNIIEYIVNSKNIHGVEINFSMDEATTYLEYNIELARKLKEHKKAFQIHLPDMTEPNMVILDGVKTICEAIHSPIQAVIHHALGKTVEEDFELTYKMLGQMYEYISKQDIPIHLLLENLNIIRSLDIFPKEQHAANMHIVGRQRINIHNMDPILKRYPQLGMCLDCGHVISDALPFQLSNIQRSRVSNMHIHDADHQSDHQLNGTCTNIKLTDAFVKTVFNLPNYSGFGVIEISKNHLCDDISNTIKILEREIQLMKGMQYTDIVLVNGDIMKRDLAFETCDACGAEKGQMHQSYCSKEICPLCDKYLSECHHREGYESQIELVTHTQTISA